MAWRARAGSAPPESTPHVWAIESIAHASFWAEPSGRSIVEVGTTIPCPVPGILLDGGAEGVGPLAPARGSAVIAARLG